MAVIAIADVEDGAEARVAGTVRALPGETLEAPISKRACVYYEIRSSMSAPDEAPDESEGIDFLVEGETGRAFVVMKDYRAAVAHREWRAVVSAVDADINAVSAKLSKLKRAVRRASPARQRELQLELNREKRLATFLCTVRAHSRGRLHACSSLEEQRKFIAENTSHYADSGATREISSRLLSRRDLVIQEGDRVQIEGHCQWQPDPDPLAAPVDYRRGAMRLLVCATRTRPLLVEVEGAKEQLAIQVQHRKKIAKKRAALKSRKTFWRTVAIVVAAAGAIGFLL